MKLKVNIGRMCGMKVYLHASFAIIPAYYPKSRLTRPLFATGHPKPLEEELVPPYRLG